MSADLLPDAWSYSSINQLMRTCGLAWACKAAGHEPDVIPVATSLGSAVHNAHAYARALQKRGEPVSVADMRDVFVDSWELITSDPRVDFESQAEREQQRATGLKVVDALHANLSVEEVLAVEEPFRLELEDDEGPLPRPLIGYLDLVVRDYETKQVCVVDLKTAARAWTNASGDVARVGTDLQSVVYLMAGAKSYGPDTSFRFEVVTKGITTKFERIYVHKTEADFRRLLKLIRVAERIVTAGATYPQPGWACNGCGYKRFCAAWHEAPLPMAAEVAA